MQGGICPFLHPTLRQYIPLDHFSSYDPGPTFKSAGSRYYTSNLYDIYVKSDPTFQICIHIQYIYLMEWNKMGGEV